MMVQSYEKSRAEQKKTRLFFMPRWSNLFKVTKNREQNKKNSFIFYAEME